MADDFDGTVDWVSRENLRILHRNFAQVLRLGSPYWRARIDADADPAPELSLELLLTDADRALLAALHIKVE